jgi:hypothetical protein
MALLAIGAGSVPSLTQRMLLSRMRRSDLEGSASGYAYEQRQGLPVSYVQYTNHGPGPYVYTDYGQYDDGLEALAPYYPLVHHYEGPHHPIDHRENQHHWHRGEEESVEEGGGAERHAEENSVHGEQGKKGYGTHHDFDKGENEDREADHQEGEYHYSSLAHLSFLGSVALVRLSAGT